MAVGGRTYAALRYAAKPSVETVEKARTEKAKSVCAKFGFALCMKIRKFRKSTRLAVQKLTKFEARRRSRPFSTVSLKRKLGGHMQRLASEIISRVNLVFLSMLPSFVLAGLSDQFRFNYAGKYTTSNGNSAGDGELMLVQGQWVNLFGSQHENEAGSQHSSVAVRLANPSGS